MALQIVRHADRPDLSAQVDELSEGVWPEYNMHGDVMNEYWGRMLDEFSEYQFLMYDDETDDLLAEGHTIPTPWQGTLEALPTGIDEAIRNAFEGGPGDTVLCAMAVEIFPSKQGRGLSTKMLEAMRTIGARHGLEHLIAPVRPSWKERYPLVPIEDYIAWRRADGSAFDPWIRVHERIGAKILKAAPESLRITGTVAEWEEWTEMPVPQSGRYVFPHGLAPLEVDREADLGSYWEPNVWIHHSITG